MCEVTDAPSLQNRNIFQTKHIKEVAEEDQHDGACPEKVQIDGLLFHQARRAAHARVR